MGREKRGRTKKVREECDDGVVEEKRERGRRRKRCAWCMTGKKILFRLAVKRKEAKTKEVQKKRR